MPVLGQIVRTSIGRTSSSGELLGRHALLIAPAVAGDEQESAARRTSTPGGTNPPSYFSCRMIDVVGTDGMIDR